MKPLQTAPETPENSPRKTSQKTLSASSPPQKKKRGTPRKSFISGLSKGFGGRRNRKGKGRGRRKAKGYSMAGKGFEGRGRKTEKGGGRKEPCGKEDTQQGPDYYLFFLPPQKKLKSAGRKDWFCKNKNTIPTTYSRSPPVPQPVER